MEEPPKKYFRLFPGNEVRLMNAYFVTCTGFERMRTQCDGCPLYLRSGDKSGSGFNARKVKERFIGWLYRRPLKAECRLYENLIDEEKGKLNADGSSKP